MKDLTQGSIVKNIIGMAAPVAAGMLFQTLYLMVDLYFVSALGDDAIAGVGAAGTLMFMIFAVTQILGVSAVAMISQSVGRKEQDQANLVFNQSLVLACMCVVLTLLFGYGFGDSFMASIAAEEGARIQGRIFLYAIVPGMGLQFVMMAMASALRGTGIVKPGMVVQVLTVVINTILAPILIAGWGTGKPLGVMGAGLATTISTAIGVGMLIFYFIKLEKYVSFQVPMWKPDFNVWRRMLSIGLPAGGEMLLLFVYFAVVYVVIQDFGAEAQAGFSIGGRVMQAIFMPTMAVAFAIGPIAGQNFGALKAGRVNETCYKGMMINTVVMLAVMILLQIKPEIIVAIFTDEAEVLKIASDFLQIISWNFVAQGIVFSCSGMFQGLGNTRPALVSSFIRLGLFIPIAFLVAGREGFEINHIWYVSVATVWIQALVSFLLVRRELGLKLGNMATTEPAEPVIST